MLRPKLTKISEVRKNTKLKTEVPVEQPERKSSSGWIGVDLDGTLAQYDNWQGPIHIGPPILTMVNRVKHWLRDGKDVRIFTARVSSISDGELEDRDVTLVRKAIAEWCVQHIGQELPITNIKDHGMIELWDDRARQVEPNTGKIKPDGFVDDVALETLSDSIGQRPGIVVKTTTVTSGSIHNDGLENQK